jgi:hypothetical protein
MIKITDINDVPDNARSIVINGEEILCFFDDDQEVINMRKYEADELRMHQRILAKQQRVSAVQRIVVTTSSGNTFNADELSQQRMARSIIVMSDTDTIQWTLADNTIATVNKSELMEALKLAGIKQTELWRID